MLLDDALEHLARKADKVVLAQGVLKLPVAALALFAGQQVGIAKLAGALAQVAAHGKQVEADLGGIVAGNSTLQNVDDACGERVGVAGSVGDGRGLQAVELVQGAVDVGICDEVEGILGLARLLCLVDEGAAAGEAVVHLSDEVGVAQGLAAELRGQDHGELAKVAQLLADLDIGRLVEEHAEEGLGGAGVLDGLGGEEDVLRGGVVEGAVARAVGRCVGLVGRVLEEEDDAIDGLEGEELRGVEGQELFELDVFDAEVFDERGEDTLATGG